MIIQAQSFSDFERCGRIPALKRSVAPARWPVRDVTKAYFAENLLVDPEQASEAFVTEAATRGFEYRQGDPYELAKDYASWLDGALRLAGEGLANPEPMPSIEIAGHEVAIDGGVSDSAQPHIFRAVSALEDKRPRWPELIAALMYGKPVTVHQTRLPGIRQHKHNKQHSSYRLGSHLVICFQHPLTGQLRLAPITEEKKSGFGHAWKMLGRWEVEATWQDWRDGLDRDRCLDRVIASHAVDLDYRARQGVWKAAEQFVREIVLGPESHLKKWEACSECVFADYCHGDQTGFVSREDVQREVRAREVAGVLS